MKADITKLAVLSFANTNIKISLIGKFCCLLPFFSCWKSRGTLTRGEKVQGKWTGAVSRVRLIGEAVRGVARGNQSQQLIDEKRASGKELKGFEAPASRNGWQFPVSMERVLFFSAEDVLLITAHQIIFL